MIARRSFFRSLALIGAAAAGAPGLFIPKLEAVTWKRGRRESRWVPNPKYHEANYEFYFMGLPMRVDPDIVLAEGGLSDSMAGWNQNGLFYPILGNEFTPDGKLISIPPFIEVTLEL